MYLSDVTFAMKNLLLSGFRDPSLLWQLAPILLLWFTLTIYFATHKTEKLGWNTSLAHGLSLFWVLASVMQHIFSNEGQFFTWTKFIIFACITVYSIFITFISFKHTLPSRWTYVFASHHLVYYLSFISILFAYDLIYLNLAMMIAIVIFFGFLLLFVYFLRKMMPALKEEVDDAPLDDTQPVSFDETPSSSGDFPPDGIESSMGENNLSENGVKF